MKKKVKILSSLLVIVLVLIQFYPTDKPVTYIDNPNDLFQDNQISKNLSTLLKSACYDCHSNETKFPWYGSIAPSKWLVYNDIIEGREELNFSEWKTLNKEDKADLLDDISIVLLDHEMPLKIYTFLHPKAKLTDKEREEISNWAETELENLYE